MFVSPTWLSASLKRLPTQTNCPETSNTSLTTPPASGQLGFVPSGFFVQLTLRSCITAFLTLLPSVHVSIYATVLKFPAQATSWKEAHVLLCPTSQAKAIPPLPVEQHKAISRLKAMELKAMGNLASLTYCPTILSRTQERNTAPVSAAAPCEKLQCIGSFCNGAGSAQHQLQHCSPGLGPPEDETLHRLWPFLLHALLECQAQVPRIHDPGVQQHLLGAAGKRGTRAPHCRPKPCTNTTAVQNI